MMRQEESGRSDEEEAEEEEEEIFELGRLRKLARIASIYHEDRGKFERNPNLSHVVHASLHFAQSIVALSIEVFHHTHHYVNQSRRQKDDTVPELPEERNPIFYIYPLCMLTSVVLGILWLSRRILIDRPQIDLVACSVSAVLILLAGIMEMKHADMYIDLAEVSDEELLAHPVFVHNFVMCILSIFGMTVYLVQNWILLDYWLWIKRERSLSDASNDLQASSSSADTDTSEILEPREKVSKHESKGKEEPGELHPIPSLENFPSLVEIRRDSVSVEEEPVLLYCCFVDWCNFLLDKFAERRPVHEFQVVHVM